VNILSAEKISKSYSEKILFDEISIGISDGDKIGVIGINGTGKSTLLKVISGDVVPDTGRIIYNSGRKIEYLPQDPYFEAGFSVLEQVFKGNSPIMGLLRDYENAMYLAVEHPGNKEYEKRLTALIQKMDTAGAWGIETEAKNILTRLGIDDFEADVGTLSGGQRKRVAMAGVLITPSDLLILDEPTNHIDNDTVDWLERYLNKRKGALLMVTHDRYFLDRVANRIIELEKGKLFIYQANYTKYLELAAERYELEEASERKSQNLYKRELEWIQRGAKARATKQKARIDRFEKLNDRQTYTANDNVEIKLASTRLGRKTIELEHICKSFPCGNIIKDFSHIFQKGDRAGIIGPNGSGKTTLLKIISGELKPDSGNVYIGDTIKFGYFNQENEGMDDSLRIIDFIRQEAEIITTEEGVASASQMLERFLFPPGAQWTPVSKLSGGEKRRLQLLKVLIGAPNVLLMDEPTNDLDVHTLTILEDYLDNFKGIVIVVSHDRYFLDRVTDKIFSFEGEGIISQHAGNYTDYIRDKEVKPSDINDVMMHAENYRYNNIKMSFEKGIEKKAKGSGNGNNSGDSTDLAAGGKRRPSDRPLKFTFKEQKEFEQINGIIEEIETKLKNTEIEIEKASSDFVRLQECISQREALEDQHDAAMERWIYLNELDEKIRGANNYVQHI